MRELPRDATVNTSDLEALRDLCLEYYREHQSDLRAIVLYGGGATAAVGRDHTPGDFDVNIFFSAHADIRSTYGIPKVIGEYDGLEVETMRNKVPDERSIQEYVAAQESKRWQHIRSNPIVQIYPDIKRLSW